MKRTLLGVLVLAGSLLAPAVAQATVSLDVTATHSPATVLRGDEYITYTVTVRNTGDSPTTAATSLDLQLPAGVFLDSGSGSGWSCNLSTEICTYSNTPPVAGNENFTALSARAFIDPATISDVPVATFTASGGGAGVSAVGQDSFTLGPQLLFGLRPGTFLAGACKAPTLTPTLDPACAAGGLGDPETQAGGHPFAANTSFEFVRKRVKPSGTFSLDTAPFESVRDATINLPPGFTANPTVIAGGCTVEQVSTSTCPERFAIGRAFADLDLTAGFSGPVDQQAVVYKVQAEEGYPATFAFRPVGISPVTITLRPKVRPGDFTITAFSPSPPQSPMLYGIKYFTFCSYGAKVEPREGINTQSAGCKSPTDAGALSIPFLTNPTRCTGQSDTTSIDVASYQHPGAKDSEGFPDLADPDWKTFSTTSPPLTGCNQLEFEPSFEGRPSTNVADAPSGLDFHLHIPQDGLVDPEGLAPSHLKDTTVTLPEGMVLNPSAANGLQACSAQQIGLVRVDHTPPYAIRFNGAEAQCPAASKIGTLTVTSPLVDQTLQGSVYLARQDDPATATPGTENPFDSLLAIYLVLRNEEIGFSAKLAGKVTADPLTGQLSTVVAENPQVPFEDLELEIFKGARASLRTPATCGLKTTGGIFIPWSAPDSGLPPPASDSFEITTAPGGGVCASSAAGLPNAPKMSAGTTVRKAGAYSPFVLKLSREDGSQEIDGLSVTLPPGLTGRLAGIPYCPESAIAQARSRSKPGDGALERDNPSCSSASQLGSVDVAAGAGPLPFHTSGTAYLSGPYKGAPVSMVVITPAVAGPFDLGTVVIRNPLYVNSVTGQVSVVSDPIPTILEGIPLDVRSITVLISRDQFTLNPTSCEPKVVTGIASGKSSDAPVSSYFQVGECSSLAFKPNLKLRLRGPTRRGAYQRLTATVTYPPGPGYANIARASVALPHSLFLAQEHIGTVCTRVQFAAHACPAASVYGHATAVTPLLAEPISGPVYLRSSANPLPDLVAALKGPDNQPIEVELAGRTDSKNGGIRNTFDVVPDAPVSKFTLQLKGGRKSLIVNSRDLCKSTQRATVRLLAQNGKRRNFRPVIKNDCGKKKRKSARPQR